MSLKQKRIKILQVKAKNKLNMPRKSIKICRGKDISKTFQCGLNEYLTLPFGECLLITQTSLERHNLQNRKSFLFDSEKNYFGLNNISDNLFTLYFEKILVCIRVVSNLLLR